MSYGISYLGSKNLLIKKIQDIFPEADNFYDLFCGGCAVTHYLIENNRYKNYFINDIQQDIVQLFIDSIQGKYKDRYEWISREDFFRLKDTDSFIRTCWSFGCKGDTYIYGRDVEPYKQALHYAVVNDDFTLFNQLYNFTLTSLSGSNIQERRLNIKQIISQHYQQQDLYGRLQAIENINHITSISESIRIEHLERLQHLEQLQGLQSSSLNYSFLDYSEVPIKDNSVIYCDIPYRNTAKYNNITFDYDRFYDWAEKQTQPIFISEYYMPEDRFICVKEIKHNVKLDKNSNKKQVIEKVFVPKNQYLRISPLMERE